MPHATSPPPLHHFRLFRLFRLFHISAIVKALHRSFNAQSTSSSGAECQRKGVAFAGNSCCGRLPAQVARVTDDCGVGMQGYFVIRRCQVKLF